MDSRQSLFNSQSKLINDLEAGLNKHVNKRLEMEGRQQARANTLARREELEERLRKGAEEVERCDSELQPVEAVLEEEEGERVSRRRRAEEELEQLAVREREVDGYLKEVGRLDRAIQEYEEENKEARFQQEMRNKKELEGKLRELRDQRRESEEQVQQIKTELASQEARHRTCEDNLKLRGYQREEAECEHVVREQKQLLQSMDWHAVMDKKKNMVERRIATFTDNIFLFVNKCHL